MNFGSIIIGVLTFVIIGVFHPIVIKAEYLWGKRCWPIFLLLGIVCVVAALFTHNMVIAAVLAVLGFTFFWSIKELYEQEERVLEGRYPKNPRRTY